MRPLQTSRDLGMAIRRARHDKGLSQVELAARAGVGRPWLSETENGKRTAEIGRILLVLSSLDLAVALIPAPIPGDAGVDLDSLLADTIG
ncbi:MAG: helix-turn-helix domain-containing protein [bacterium]|nr:helix-turn-helix domain-containing protein [bacterium]